jgi:hypothetical protein
MPTKYKKSNFRPVCWPGKYYHRVVNGKRVRCRKPSAKLHTGPRGGKYRMAKARGRGKPRTLKIYE